MTSPFLSQRELEALPPDHFAWGCCIRDGIKFSYIYGTVADYLAAARHTLAGDTLHKGRCETLDEARHLGQERAAELATVYEGIGSVRALSARAYLAELGPFTGAAHPPYVWNIPRRPA